MKIIFFLILGILTTPLFSCEEKLKPYNLECEMQDRFLQSKQDADLLNINLDFLSQGRALRFINFYDWLKFQANDYRPWLVYQPAPQTWESWDKVANLLYTKKNERPVFTLDLIAEINKKALAGGLSYTKILTPGKFRNGFNQYIVNYKINCENKSMNQSLYNYYQNFDLLDYSGRKLIRLEVTKCRKNNIDEEQFYFGNVVYTKPRMVIGEVKRWLSFVNENLEKFTNLTQSLDYSPLDFIADAQRRLVAIHPFADGNGRTSRFVQDLLTQYFNLPYLPSGRLSNDVEVYGIDYRKNVKASMNITLDYFLVCLDELKRMTPDYTKVSNQCRPLPITGI